jgi:hypothetical protein
MAIGSARMIGYDLPENFRMPYLSTSITEFWRRWHMTLSSWLRDYLYIPLGGNRQGTLLTYRNLFLTMLLGGLWHGANWNFILWGGLHGGALAANKLWSKFFNRQWALPASFGWALTLLFVMLCWVPFRSASFGDTMVIFRAMAGVGAGHYQWLPAWLFWCLCLCILGHWMGWYVERRKLAMQLATNTGNELALEDLQPIATSPETITKRVQNNLPRLSGFWNRLAGSLGMNFETHELSGSWLVPVKVTVAGAYAVALLVLVILFFAPLDDNPFIYFQF